MTVLSESENFLAAAVRSSPLPILGLDAASVVRRANPAADELAGLPSGALVGQSLLSLFPPNHASPNLPRSIGGDETRDEWQLLRPSGGRVRAEATLIYDAQSALTVVYLRDLDSVDRRERALRDSEELFARSFLGAPLALSVSNAQTGSFVLVNDEFLALTGYWRSEVIGRSAERLGLWDNPADRAALSERLAAGEPTPDFQSLFRRKDGAKAAATGRIRTVEIGGQLCVVTAALPLS